MSSSIYSSVDLNENGWLAFTKVLELSIVAPAAPIVDLPTIKNKEMLLDYI
jgi:hypothetical protein